MPTRTTPSTGEDFFLYARKSTESEDRQVLSIDSQTDEVKALAERLGLRIVEVISEARSAKAPGRPVFNEMMRRIHVGEARGILCWKLDRLARNPVDGGSLIWAVKQQGIRIVTPTQTYSHADDNMILMYIEFGMAHKYIDDLGRAVKRGLLAKAQRGWYPTVAPLGYLNDPRSPKGHKAVLPDPERFTLVRKMWDLMLAGTTSPPKILKITTDEWGLRTRSGQPLSRSGVYRIFSSPFYAGTFEYPVGSGHWFKGSHEPMVTTAEYDRVQKLLGSRGRPRAVSKTFAYTGLIRCGSCSAMVTAEEKHQLICATCRYKFAYRGREFCPRCETPIKKMIRPTSRRRATVLHYTYYHCTKRKDPTCPERVVHETDLDGHLADYLEKVEVSERFQQWVLERLRRSHENEAEGRNAIIRSQQKAYQACVARVDNLVRLKTSSENVDGSLLSDDEYARQRMQLLKEKSRLGELSRDTGDRVTKWLDLIDQVFAFTRGAKAWLKEQDPETKRLILAVLADDSGSNLTLTRKMLRIYAPKPFPILEMSLPGVAAETRRFEPTKSGSIKAQSEAFDLGLRPNLARRDDARTYGKAGLRLVMELRQWLASTPAGELRQLQDKLQRLFHRIHTIKNTA